MITTRTWKRVCYSVLALLVPFYIALFLNALFNLSDTTTRVLLYSMIVGSLALIWRPRRAS